MQRFFLSMQLLQSTTVFSITKNQKILKHAKQMADHGQTLRGSQAYECRLAGEEN